MTAIIPFGIFTASKTNVDQRIGGLPPGIFFGRLLAFLSHLDRSSLFHPFLA
ncbi:hypothetical protein [Noviherbaspirillum sedimenti]|uniref:hypothetical protein n=1 Tax=Noviherbaspirillum sedimenti TaxID=2320865 RepID=UPI00131494EC|nr:hypothetical protein [Noviherbaspirillum sedimenti]